MPDRERNVSQKEIVRHFAFRLGGLNGYRFGPDRGWILPDHKPTNRKQQLEAIDDNRRQYIIDML